VIIAKFAIANRGYNPSCDRDYKRDKFERKAPPEFSGKPCRVHGNKAKHTYEECRDNPKNRKPSSGNCDDDNNKKRHHDAHYHDKRYLSSQDESPDDHRTPEPSDDDGTQTAKTASATKKITMSILVKYLEKRGISVWSRGIFEMRSHLIPRSM
jgi:hypothetical protein